MRLQQAHARALAEAGVLSAEELADVKAGLERIESRFAGRPCPSSPDEDLHTWVETALVDTVGGAGRKVHTARSRNDQVATLLRMYVIDAGERLADALASLARTACRRAEEWSALPMPMMTHQQFAAPGTAGFWVLRYAAALERLRRHVLWCAAQWRRECPLGSGAVAGSSIRVDRRIQARELGFDGPSASALESTSTRDECVELLALAAQAALHLQSFAADVICFSQTPLGWVRYPAEFGTGSSMMPNKRNPDAMELLRGECCAVAAAHGQAVLLLKGLPSGYNRDLQCLKPLVRRAAEGLIRLCSLADAFLGRLEFDPDRLTESMRLGAMDATMRMEELVRRGTPLRDAHHRVAEQVAQGATGGRDAAALLESYCTIGGANPAETRGVAAALLARLTGASEQFG